MTAPNVPAGGYSSDPNYVPPPPPAGFYDDYYKMVATAGAGGWIDPAGEAYRAEQNAASAAANAVAAENDRLAAVKSIRDAGGLFLEDRATQEAAGITYGDAFWAGNISSADWGTGKAPPPQPDDAAPATRPVITTDRVAGILQLNDAPTAVYRAAGTSDPAVSLQLSNFVIVAVISAFVLAGYYLYTRRA